MVRYIIICIILKLAVSTTPAMAFTANSVSFETLDRGWRVYVEYTIPQIKELRQAFVEFRSYEKAAEFYWKLVRGANFYLTPGGKIKFITPPKTPDPW